jgi:hypothetical protein
VHAHSDRGSRPPGSLREPQIHDYKPTSFSLSEQGIHQEACAYTWRIAATERPAFSAPTSADAPPRIGRVYQLRNPGERLVAQLEQAIAGTDKLARHEHAR